MRRGELYRVYRGNKNDPKDYRVFVIVSRQALLESRFATVICAPVYSTSVMLSTQFEVGVEEGMKTQSYVFCDELVSIEKSRLSHYVGSLGPVKMAKLESALKIAVGIE